MFKAEIWMWNLTAKMIEYLVWGLDLLSMDKMKFSGITLWNKQTWITFLNRLKIEESCKPQKMPCFTTLYYNDG